jgi:hypothetical protein
MEPTHQLGSRNRGVRFMQTLSQGHRSPPQASGPHAVSALLKIIVDPNAAASPLPDVGSRQRARPLNAFDSFCAAKSPGERSAGLA